MLLSYDLPVHVGKDGKPISRFLASRGRNFHQMLTALLHEVNAAAFIPLIEPFGALLRPWLEFTFAYFN